MTSSPPITVLRFTRGTASDARKGLLGFATCSYGDLILDGIAVRRTRDGRHVLSFPTRHDRAGRQHHVVRPADTAARTAFEEAVFDALGLDEEVRP